MADDFMTDLTERDGVFLDQGVLESVRREGPLVLPWPSPGNPGAILSFATPDDWRTFVLGLGLRHGIPEIVAAKFRRAQMAYLLAWAYFDLIKAGELAALVTLELALKDRYGHKVKPRNGRISFAELLKFMVNGDGLTDDRLQRLRPYGGSVIARIDGTLKPSLSDIRNGHAHGDPFDGFPYGGLLEVVRNLIEYAYRDMIGASDSG